MIIKYFANLVCLSVIVVGSEQRKSGMGVVFEALPAVKSSNSSDISPFTYPECSLVPPGPLFICVFRGPGTRSHVTLDTT